MKKLKEELKYGKRGITLIALVITIIVLLILAGVSIATLTGDNGILTRANDARTSTEIGEEREKVELSAVGALAKDNGGEIKRNYLNDELASYIGTEGTDYTLSESETAPFVVTYSDSGRSYLIDENGIVSEYVDISKYVGVGDYVDYNPTVSDKSGTPVEGSKLTYTSPTGSGTEHGNGYISTEEGGGQTFTATASTKWKVLDIGIGTGTVTLISENVITTDAGKNFVMKGAIGYLYAEQELNEICKIYGYGYGANTSQVTEYSYGGPLDGDLIGQITGSGARSITIKDINKKAGIYEDEDGILKFSDGTVVSSSYGDTTNPTTNIYYPTIATSTGKSNSAGVKNLEQTYYGYNKTKIENTDIQNISFNGRYWLASRGINNYSDSNGNDVDVLTVGSNGTGGYALCYGGTSNLGEGTASTNYAVRPIVILKSNVIDTSTNYETEGHWNLK